MRTLIVAVITVVSLATAILPAATSHAWAGENPQATRMQQTGAYGG